MQPILNKIDPVILNNVQQQTVAGVVHTYEKTRVSKDGKRDTGNGASYKKKKEKLVKFNSILKDMDLDITLKLDGDLIVMVDGDGNIISTYAGNEIAKLLERMEDMVGVIVDTKR